MNVTLGRNGRHFGSERDPAAEVAVVVASKDRAIARFRDAA